MKVLAIVPAYNEEEAILATVTEIKIACPEIDVLVINDASKDNTRGILRNNNIKHLDLSTNLGIGGAVQAGYLYAFENGYDIAVQMDGDGQHPASELSKVLAPILKGEANIVIGSRFVENEGFQSTFLRRFGIRFLSTIIYLCTKQKVLDVTSGYRSADRNCIKLFSAEYAQDYPEPEAIVTVSKHGLVVSEVPVSMRERQGGVSSISAFKSVYYMLKVSLAIIFRSLSK